MPPLTPPRAPSGPRRRSLLAGALGAGTAAVLLPACSGGGTAPEEAKQASAERRLRARSAEDSRTLLRRYDATAEAHPGLAALLAPLRAETERHARAFEDGAGPGSGAASPDGPSAPARDGGPATTSPGPGPGADGGAPDVPGDEKAALEALAGAERRAADTRTGALTGASPELARLLASVAACGAAHAYLLTEAS
ncbi:hypothetical protein CRI70_01100 [Streptomyces sp. Ru87]|nr:hypothetical protein CRI70_01100 [Streptomyces sp. Ru87]